MPLYLMTCSFINLVLCQCLRKCSICCNDFPAWLCVTTSLHRIFGVWPLPVPRGSTGPFLVLSKAMASGAALLCAVWPTVLTRTRQSFHPGPHCECGASSTSLPGRHVLFPLDLNP